MTVKSEIRIQKSDGKRDVNPKPRALGVESRLAVCVVVWRQDSGRFVAEEGGGTDPGQTWYTGALCRAVRQLVTGWNGLKRFVTLLFYWQAMVRRLQKMALNSSCFERTLSPRVGITNS